MVQRTLINGTGYTIIGGRTLIDGTGYAIKKGRTLIGGTGYDIKLTKYRLDSWIGGDGDEYITELSRSWSAIRKGCVTFHDYKGVRKYERQGIFRLSAYRTGSRR